MRRSLLLFWLIGLFSFFTGVMPGYGGGPATQPSAPAGKSGGSVPAIESEVELKQFDVVSRFNASGVSTPDWALSAVAGTYKQKCRDVEVQGKIVAIRSINVSNLEQLAFVIDGKFFVQPNESARLGTSPRKMSATVDQDVWKSDDGKSKIVLAHGTAYMLLKGEPGHFQPVGILAPVIEPAATQPTTTATTAAFPAVGTTTRPAQLILTRIVAETGDASKVALSLKVGDTAHGEIVGVAGGGLSVAKGKFTLKAPEGVKTFIVGGTSATIRESFKEVGEIPLSVEGEFLVDETLKMTTKGEWDGLKNGAVHTVLGKLTMFDYEFQSDEKAPLKFRVTKGGYVYLEGKGTVKDLKTGKIIEMK